MRTYFQDGEKTIIQQEVGFAKELEVVDILFNADCDYYNYRMSKNTPEIEDKLAKIFEGFEPLEEDFEEGNTSSFEEVNQV